MAIRIASDQVPTGKTLLSLASTIQVPPIAIGTWAWGDSPFGKWSSENDAQARAAFKTSCDEGIGFFDTAEIYGKGKSEEVIGKYMKETGFKPVIATKFLPLPYLWNYPSCLITHLKASLKRLGVKQVDLYQIHGPIHLRAISVVAGGLAEAVKQGLTKSVGVSNYSQSQVVTMHRELQKHGISLASNQIEFSLLRRLPETNGMIKACHDLGVAVFAYSPLGMGRLTGKYSPENPPPSGRRFSNYDMNKLVPLLNVIRELSKKYETTMSAVALNWVIYKGAIPLAGAKNAEQAEQNAKCLGWRLSDEDVKKLDDQSIEGNTNWIWQHG